MPDGNGAAQAQHRLTAATGALAACTVRRMRHTPEARLALVCRYLESQIAAQGPISALTRADLELLLS
jgi:hypothetical protein